MYQPLALLYNCDREATSQQGRSAVSRKSVAAPFFFFFVCSGEMRKLFALPSSHTLNVVACFSARFRLLEFCQKHSCNGAIVSDAEGGDIVQMSGDQRTNIHEFLVDQQICVASQVRGRVVVVSPNGRRDGWFCSRMVLLLTDSNVAVGADGGDLSAKRTA